MSIRDGALVAFDITILSVTFYVVGRLLQIIFSLEFSSYSPITTVFLVISIGIPFLLMVVFILPIIINILNERTRFPIMALISKGGSMSPVLPPGRKIVFGIKSNNYSIGDMVAFETESESSVNELIGHRIIDSSPEGYIVQGDSNTVIDGEIREEQIQMKIISIGAVPIYIPLQRRSRIGMTLSFLLLLISKMTGKKLPHSKNIQREMSDYSTASVYQLENGNSGKDCEEK